MRNIARTRDAVPTETRTDLAFHNSRTQEHRPRAGMDSLLGNLGQSMRMYGDDDEDDIWPMEKIPESEGTTTVVPTEDSRHATDEQSFDTGLGFAGGGIAI